MNIYKRKKFINKFELDYSNFQIIECPDTKVPILSEYDEKNFLLKAYFDKNDCDNCRYSKSCIKQDFDDSCYEVVIKKESLCNVSSVNNNPKESNNLIDKSLEAMLIMPIEFEIGSITNAQKKRGKKYEDGIISYDGDYLEANVFGEKKWYCHGYGKAYYEENSLEYEGYFVYGHPHGNGKYYYRNGQVKWEGIFEAIPGFGDIGMEAHTTAEGYVDSRGRIKCGKKFNESGKLEYEGDFKLGTPEGHGKLYDDNQKLIFVGEFKDGKPKGENELEEMAQKESKVYYRDSDKPKSQNVNDDFIIEENGLKYLGESAEVIVPKSIDGKIIDKIAPEGFARKRVKRVVLPNTVKVIGRSAFADCRELTEIIIPDSITNIEAWAFGTCSSLRKIELSDNVIEIGSHAFDECYNLKHVKLPKEINYIGAYAFSETGLDKIILPKGIKYLANSLFYDCRYLGEVVLNDDIETIGNYTFGNCVSLKKIILPDSIKQITYASFDGCVSLTSIRIPKDLNEMDETSFSNCINLQKVETNDINKKIAKFDIQNETAKSFGITGSDLNNKPKYDTIYNMLIGCTSKQIKVIPIDNKTENEEGDYVTLLEKGISLKHLGKYEEAKEMYIKAIHLENTHPNGYYNLAKILYILGEYKASAKAYKASFERGVCELQQSMNVGYARFDTSSLYVHLGHALLDEENREGQYGECVKRYEEGVDPRRVKGYKPSRGNYRTDAYNEYDIMCVAAAKSYLGV